MKVLSLFSGGGLGDYGLELGGMTIAGQVEIDAYCQKILKLRWPDVPKWEDIRNVKGKEIRERCGAIELVSGGFPCQPFSVAGKQRGSEDDRHLWPEMLRIIQEVKPTWVLGENVSGLIKLGLDQVLSDLEGAGYTCQSFIIPACAVDAPHRRDRVWIVGHSEHARLNAAKIAGGTSPRGDSSETREIEAGEPERSSQQHEDVGNADGQRDRGRSRKDQKEGGARQGEGTQLRAKHRNETGVPSKDVADTEGRVVREVRDKGKEKRPRSSDELSGDGGGLHRKPTEDVADTVSDAEGSTHRKGIGIRKRGRKKQDISERNEVGSDIGDSRQDVADANTERSQGSGSDDDPKGRQKQTERQTRLRNLRAREWPTEPDVGRVAHGIANRVDRLKLLGNGQVVQAVQAIAEIIKSAEEHRE